MEPLGRPGECIVDGLRRQRAGLGNMHVAAEPAGRHLELQASEGDDPAREHRQQPVVVDQLAVQLQLSGDVGERGRSDIRRESPGDERSDRLVVHVVHRRRELVPVDTAQKSRTAGREHAAQRIARFRRSPGSAHRVGWPAAKYSTRPASRAGTGSAPPSPRRETVATTPVATALRAATGDVCASAPLRTNSQKLRDHEGIRAAVAADPLGHHERLVGRRRAPVPTIPEPDLRPGVVAEVLDAPLGADDRVVAPVVRGEVALLVRREDPVVELHVDQRDVLDVDHRVETVERGGWPVVEAEPVRIRSPARSRRSSMAP